MFEIRIPPLEFFSAVVTDRLVKMAKDSSAPASRSCTQSTGMPDSMKRQTQPQLWNSAAIQLFAKVVGLSALILSQLPKLYDSGPWGFCRDWEHRIPQACEAAPPGKVNFLHFVSFQSACLAFDAHLSAFVRKSNRWAGKKKALMTSHLQLPDLPN